MPYVPVPKDLTKVKTKVAAGLTKRQLICFSLAALVGLPVYFFTRGAIGNSVAVVLMFFVLFTSPKPRDPTYTRNAFFSSQKKKENAPEHECCC